MSFWDTLKQEVMAQGAVDLAKSFFGAILSKVGDTAGQKIPQTVEDYMTIKFGLKTVDERLYNEAVRKMKLPDRVRLAKKLATLAAPGNPQLSDERFNYFRICLPLTDPDKTAEILTGYAQLSDPQWVRECTIMGFKFESDGISVQKVIDAVAGRQQAISASFSAHPVRDRMKTYRDNARNRANGQNW